MSVSLALLALATLEVASAAEARIPVFSGSCPGVDVQTSAKGRATINGRSASIKTINANAWDVRCSGYTVSLSRDAASASLNAVYTGPHGANGICQVAERAAQAGSISTSSARMAAKNAKTCLLAVRRQTNNRDVVILESESSQAKDTIILGVGPQRAKWKCVAKENGAADVQSLTDEGAL